MKPKKGLIMPSSDYSRTFANYFATYGWIIPILVIITLFLNLI